MIKCMCQIVDPVISWCKSFLLKNSLQIGSVELYCLAVFSEISTVVTVLKNASCLVTKNGCQCIFIDSKTSVIYDNFSCICSLSSHLEGISIKNKIVDWPTILFFVRKMNLTHQACSMAMDKGSSTSTKDFIWGSRWRMMLRLRAVVGQKQVSLLKY